MDIDGYCLDIQMMCQVGDSLNQILQRMQEVGMVVRDQEQLQEVAELVVELGNNTRVWSNNGFTPKELFELEEKQHFMELEETRHVSRKVGRNEQCPCGSGKKYKRCCL